MLINIKTVPKCAFCKYWNDPQHRAIEPKNPSMGLWKITSSQMTCMCLKKNLTTRATSFCNYYVCKLPR